MAENKATLKGIVDAKQAYSQREKSLIGAKKKAFKTTLLSEKVAAKAATRILMESVYDTVSFCLENDGVFYSPVERQVENEFLNWLYSNVDSMSEASKICQTMADDVITQSLQTRFRSHAAFSKCSDGFIRLSVNGRELGVEVIGPIAVSGHETLHEIERKIEVGYLRSQSSNLVNMVPSCG